MTRLILGISISRWLLAVTVLIGIILRFYNYPNRISMGLDSARDALVAFEGARTMQFPLTGPFISIAPVTTGPWYWIQLIIAKLILQTYLAPWLLLGIYSVLMIIVMYKAGLYLQGKLLGVIMALFTALSPNQIANSVGLTNPAVVGFYTGIVFLLIMMIARGKTGEFRGLLLGIVTGITVNTHYQSLSILSLFLIFFIDWKKYRSLSPYLILGMFLTFIPLLVFELNSHWYNSRGLWNYFTVEQFKITTPMSWKIYLSDFWPNFMAYVFGGDRLTGIVLMISISLAFAYRFSKRNLKKVEIFILISFLSEVVLVRYYRGERYFGYLQFFHPYLIYFTGNVFHVLLRHGKFRVIGVFLFVLLLLKIIPSSLAALTPEPLTVDANSLLSDFKKRFGNGPYSLYRCQSLLKPELNAILVTMLINHLYSDSGRPLLYYWGCQYPDLMIGGRKVIADLDTIENANFPGVNRLRRVEIAPAGDLDRAGWKSITPLQAYQSAARWWMDEQP